MPPRLARRRARRSRPGCRPAFSRRDPLRLLLTRAAADAARTRARLETAGHEVLVSPVIEVLGTGAAWPAGVVDAVLATSGQAFALSDGLSGGPSPEARRLMPLFFVGERTLEQALRHGFTGAAHVAPRAADLAILFEGPASTVRRLVYLAGRDRKPDLEAALAGRALEVLEVYAAQAAAALDPVTTRALAVGAIDGVLHFSRRSAAVFCALAAAERLDVAPLTHFCLSEDVAAPLREAGCAAIRIAATPDEAALLAAVECDTSPRA